MFIVCEHFPCYSAAVSSRRSPVLWAALCCPLTDREQGRLVWTCAGLGISNVLHSWLCRRQKGGVGVSTAPFQTCLCLPRLLQWRRHHGADPVRTPWHFWNVLHLHRRKQTAQLPFSPLTPNSSWFNLLQTGLSYMQTRIRCSMLVLYSSVPSSCHCSSASGGRKRATCGREFRIKGGCVLRNLERPTGVWRRGLSPFIRIKLQDSFVDAGFS